MPNRNQAQKKASGVTRDPELQLLTLLLKLFHRLCRKNKQLPFETNQNSLVGYPFLNSSRTGNLEGVCRFYSQS